MILGGGREGQEGTFKLVARIRDRRAGVQHSTVITVHLTSLGAGTSGEQSVLGIQSAFHLCTLLLFTAHTLNIPGELGMLVLYADEHADETLPNNASVAYRLIELAAYALLFACHH